MGPIILLLLPALGYASITVNLKAGPSMNQASVTYFGNDSNIISDIEREAFNITTLTLKKAVGCYFGKEPLDVFVKNPTTWGDLYKTYSWPEVNRTAKVKNARIIEVKTTEVTLAKGVYNNKISEVGSFTSNFKGEVVNRVMNDFVGKELAADVNYNVDLVVGFLPPVRLTFVSHLSNNTELKDNRTLQAVGEVRFNLKPSQSAESVLNATKVTIKVLVNYETSLSGNILINYNPRYNGHHFWALDVTRVLKACKMPWLQRASDLVTVEYYRDAKVVVVDKETGRTIVSEDAEYEYV